MTDLEQELTRQIHELSKDIAALRERVAVLERKPWPTTPYEPFPMPHQPTWTGDPNHPPYKVTITDSTEGKP